MTSENFLREYLRNPSPTGFEAKSQKIWMDYLRPYADDFITDAYGNAVAVVNPGQDYKIVLEAHADEISWLVSYVHPDGFIYLKRNGGSDPVIAPGKTVNIHGEHGIVKGVFGWPAIHTRNSNKAETPKTNKIFVDIGAKNDKEVYDLGIYPGIVLTFDDEFMILNDRYYCGRALDNRIGGYILSQVARNLKNKGANLPYTLYLVNSVQEEVGLNGARIIAERLKPDAAIVIDVTHDTTTPMMDKIEYGNIHCGKGPVITVAPSVHNVLRRFIIDTCKEHDIKLQPDSASRTTGTDTEAFAFSGTGVPSALVSIPLRYMHTTVEMCQIKDVNDTIDLLEKVVLKIKSGQKFSYF